MNKKDQERVAASDEQFREHCRVVGRSLTILHDVVNGADQMEEIPGPKVPISARDKWHSLEPMHTVQEVIAAAAMVLYDALNK